MIYYVNGETGLDTNDGLTPENAFKTISKARLECDDINGDTIYIEGKKTDSSQIIYDEVFYGGKSDYSNTLSYIVNNLFKPIFFIDKTIKYIGLNNPIIENSGSSFTIYIANGYGNFYCKSISFSNLSNSASALCNFQSYGYDMIFDDCSFVHNTRFKAGNSNGRYVFYNCKFYPTEVDLFLDVGSYKSEVYYVNCSASKRLIFSGGGYRYQNIMNSFSEYGCHCLDSVFSSNTGIVIDVEFRLVNNSTNNYIYCNFKNGYVIESDSKNLFFLNCNFLNKEELQYSDNFIFKNCILSANLFECSTINCNFPKFENCIFVGDKPLDIPDENFINCVFNTDPLLDVNYKPLVNSPCLPKNWTGETPIDTFIGRYDYENIAPEIYTLYIIGNSGKIPISIGLIDDNTLIELEIMFSIDNGEIWNDCTIEYNSGVFGKAGEIGILNEFLWNTSIDIPGIEDVILRVKGFDGDKYSEYIYTSEFSIDNINISPDVKWLTPLKFKLEDNNKLYFKIKK